MTQEFIDKITKHCPSNNNIPASLEKKLYESLQFSYENNRQTYLEHNHQLNIKEKNTPIDMIIR